MSGPRIWGTALETRSELEAERVARALRMIGFVAEARPVGDGWGVRVLYEMEEAACERVREMHEMRLRARADDAWAEDLRRAGEEL